MQLVYFSLRYFIKVYAHIIPEKYIFTRSRHIEDIVRYVLKLSLVDLYDKHVVIITIKQYYEIFNLLNRRRIGEPLQYIIGELQFRYLTIYINKFVLIPRFETEQLIDLILPYITPKSVIIDIGTGSGVIALSLDQERRFCFNSVDFPILGLDINKHAIVLANKNKKINNIKSVIFLNRNILQKISNNSVDILVANLPYLTQKEYNNLPFVIKNFEPKLALYGGVDGLIYIKKLFKEAIYVVRKRGLIFLEIGGAEQGNLISKYIYNKYINDFCVIRFEKDYCNKTRFIIIQRI